MLKRLSISSLSKKSFARQNSKPRSGGEYVKEEKVEIHSEIIDVVEEEVEESTFYKHVNNEEESYIWNLPKAQLHVHMTGSLRRSTLEELENKHGISENEKARLLKGEDQYKDYAQFARKGYDIARKCIKDESDIKRVLDDIIGDSILENVKWVEVSVYPISFAQDLGTSDMSLDEMLSKLMALFNEKVAEASERGLGLGFVFTAVRSKTFPDIKVPEYEYKDDYEKYIEKFEQYKKDLVEARQKEALFLAKLAVQQKRVQDGDEVSGCVVGFGLSGADNVLDYNSFNPHGTFHTSLFKSAFIYARTNGLLVNPHCGETKMIKNGDPYLNGFGAIIDAFQVKPNRLGHGIAAADSKACMKQLVDNDICLEVCPTSNYKLSYFKKFNQHPLKTLLENNVACTLGSDDPLFFSDYDWYSQNMPKSIKEEPMASGLVYEYAMAIEKLEIPKSQIIQLMKNSFKYSSAPKSIKDKYLAELEEYKVNNNL